MQVSEIDCNHLAGEILQRDSDVSKNQTKLQMKVMIP